MVSRPGYSLADVGQALPESLRPPDLATMRRRQANGTIVSMGATVHLLGEVKERVSSTQIRTAAAKSVKQLSRYVPPLVAEYIRKESLYVGSSAQTNGASAAKVLSSQEGRHHSHAGRSHKNG